MIDFIILQASEIISLMHSTLHQYAKDILETRIRQYKETPQHIVENYVSEKANIDSYNGRQLLEMLQNADDAAERPDCAKQALVKLKDGILTIANHGYPFSKGGLESILFSNLSPKAVEQNLIGQKGLGFRSILSWADEVIISSEGLNLMFSKQEACKVLEGIISEVPTIRPYLKSKTLDENPIAILRVPTISDYTPELSGRFDTLITIKLKAGIEPEVQQQINTIVDGETLLFLNNLRGITLESPGRNLHISKAFENGQVVISLDSPSTGHLSKKLWTVEHKKGCHKDKNYELKVAYTDGLEHHSGRLHSYFRTNDALNFPGLVHGTFELNPDRNHLVDDADGFNRFLIKELAVFLVEVAKGMAAKHSPASYHALRFLNINTSSISGFFKDFQLPALLSEEIKKNKLFPNVNGEYVDFLDNRVYYDEEISQYLRGEDVSSLLPHTADARLVGFIKSFGNFHYNAGHFSRIISKRSILPAEQYAALILAMLKSRYEEIKGLNGNYDSIEPFFTDDAGRFIAWDSQAFLPHEHDTDVLELPEEIKVSFLNKEIGRAMLKSFGIQDFIYLDSRLLPFKFRRFSISGFADTLKEHYLNSPTNENVAAFHFSLNQIAALQLAGGEDIYREKALTYFPGISRSGKIKPLSELYFGMEYGGELTEELLKHNPDLLLAAPGAFGLPEPGEYHNYFRWLGVEAGPQFKPMIIDEQHIHYRQFKEHFLATYDYSLIFAGTRYGNRQQAEAGIIAFYIDTFEHLGPILENAPYRAIFSWIKENHRLRQALDSKYETKNQPMLGSRHSNSAVIYKKLPNYTAWLFGTTAWIPSENGITAPQNCCTSKTIGNLLSPLLVKPQLDEVALKRILTTDARGLDEYYRLIGIHLDLGSLSTEQLYSMLNNLPATDPTGKIAKSLYQEVMSNFDPETLELSNSEYQKFLNYGKIWTGKNGNTKYVDVSEAFYLETKRYGENITSEFHLVPLQRKQGNQKVLKLFGVKPLTGISFELSGIPTPHLLNGSFKQETEQFKALAYALVYQFDSQDRVKTALRSLSITLVSKLQGSFEHAGIKRDFELGDYDFIITGNNISTKYYIKIPLATATMQPLRANLAFAESVAEIFSTIFRSETQRSFIRELYSRQPSEREALLMHEIQTDGHIKLLRAKKLLGIEVDLRAAFWKAVFQCKGLQIPSEVFGDPQALETLVRAKIKADKASLSFLLENDNFKNLYSLQFLAPVYKLIVENELDTEKFQLHFEELDFERFLSKRFESIRDSLEQVFEYTLFQQLSANGSLQARAAYFDKCYGFSQSVYRTHDGFQTDITAYLIRRTAEDYNLELTAPESPEGWNVNTLFEKMHQDSGLFTEGDFNLEGFTPPQVQSLLLFGEYDMLKKTVQDQIQKEPDAKPISEGNKIIPDLAKDDYKSIAEKMDASYDYQLYEIGESSGERASEPVQATHPDARPRSFRGEKSPQSIDSETIGFIAEKLVYETLRVKYPRGKVLWKSENGRRSGAYVMGVSGLGYDMEYTNDSKKTYVEVKCIVSPELGFKMSDNELGFALANAEDYLLITVENISGKKPVITAYPDFFVLKDDETLLENNSFKIRQESYKISFKKQVK